MSNATKTPTDAQARRPRYCAPEEAFQPPAITSLDEIEDALTCILTRCEAQVQLMFFCAENGELSDALLINSIWLLQGQLEQMHSMIRAREPGRVLQ